ncbi:hypothetical protein [Actinopolyspora halophila]|uniref:hypothetical protein n=1 Tax=Actinopolyspora halophila TaxID=1850 RepID=UPI0003747EDC|nr:hypothetical protein [Actinopolyspora halophila]
MRMGRGVAMVVASGAAMLAMAVPASASSEGEAVANEAMMAGMKQVCMTMMQDKPGMEQARGAMMRNPAMAEMCEMMMKNNPGMARECGVMISGAMSRS